MNLSTRILISAIITPITDYCCQTFIEKTNKYDHMRTLRQSLVVSCFVTPSVYIWSTKIVSNYLKGAIGKTRLNKDHILLYFGEMLVLQPWIMFGIFFNLELLRTMSFKCSIQNAFNKSPISLGYSILYFPVIMLLKFRYISAYYRPIFFTLCNLPFALNNSFLQNIEKNVTDAKKIAIKNYINTATKYNLYLRIP